MADVDLDGLWTAYLQAEREGVKETRVKALDLLVDAAERLPGDARAAWALDVARRVADEKADLPIRFPLFRRVLLPPLIDGILAKRPGCARWLSEFQSLLVHSEEEAARLPEDLRRPVELLKEALRVDPSDDRARHKLIDLHAGYLRYTLHELPSGVLFGHDGASADACAELLALLSEFREDLAKADRTEEFADLLKDCGYHYAKYRDYLLAGCPGGSYAAFLASRP